MVAFLFALACVAILMFAGFMFDLYLYNKGAIGKKHFRRSSHPDDVKTQFYMNVGSVPHSEVQYARAGMLVFFAGIVVISLFITLLLGLFGH